MSMTEESNFGVDSAVDGDHARPNADNSSDLSVNLNDLRRNLPQINEVDESKNYRK